MADSLRRDTQADFLSFLGDVCEIGGVDDGTLRVCCSTHAKVLCAHHYARTHFVMTMPEYTAILACNAHSHGATSDANAPDQPRALRSGHLSDLEVRE